MSEESKKNQQQPSSPHTVESTSSSVTGDNDSSSSPNGSEIIDNKYLAQTLHSYIDALKFDPAAGQEESVVNQDSSVAVDELLGRNKTSGGGKKGKNGNASTKSKVTFSGSKSSSNNLERNSSARSQAQVGSQESGKRGKTKSSTNTVIREWGKRPMLVESEAPWTPRNRMYSNALKAVARAKQLNPEGAANNNLPPYSLQPMGSAPPPSPMGFITNTGTQPIFLPVNNVPQFFQYGPVSPVGQQQPVLTGISPIPGVDINNRPVAVTFESPPSYPHPGMPLPVPQPESVTYGQLNSQGVWVPLMEQPQLYQRQQQP